MKPATSLVSLCPWMPVSAISRRSRSSGWRSDVSAEEGRQRPLPSRELGSQRTAHNDQSGPDGTAGTRHVREGITMTTDIQGEQTVFNHVGICVTDLERSRKFYEEVLQFRYWWELEAPDEGTSQLLQIPAPVGLRAVYLRRDGLVLELLHFSEAEARPFRQRVMN